MQRRPKIRKKMVPPKIRRMGDGLMVGYLPKMHNETKRT